MALTLDQQHVTKLCAHCRREFAVVRGSVFWDGHPMGLYLVALHSCPSDSRAHLAVAILEGTPVAAAIEVRPSEASIGFSFVDWSGSPWRTEAYLGSLLSRDAVLASSLRTRFLHIAEHVTRELPLVATYVNAEPAI